MYSIAYIDMAGFHFLSIVSGAHLCTTLRESMAQLVGVISTCLHCYFVITEINQCKYEFASAQLKCYL